MKIEARFDVNDSVYVLSNNKVYNGRVKEISFKRTRLKEEDEITYVVSITPSESCTRDESHVFISKEELLESL